MTMTLDIYEELDENNEDETTISFTGTLEREGKNGTTEVADWNTFEGRYVFNLVVGKNNLRNHVYTLV